MDRGKIVFSLIAVVAALVFVRLGFWQLGRHGDARDANERRAARLAEPATPLASLLDDPTALAADDLEWQRVSIAGEWRYEREVLIRNRGRGGRPGVHVITPLVVEGASGDGPSREVLVLRGWLPAPDATDPGPVPTGNPRLSPSDARIGVLRTSRQGEGEPVVRIGEGAGDVERLTFAAIDVDAIRDATREDAPGRSGAVASEAAPEAASEEVPFFVQLLPAADPDAGSGRGPLPVPLPEPGNGPHLSYAIQWFAFAAVALIGTWALLFRPRRLRRGPEPV